MMPPGLTKRYGLKWPADHLGLDLFVAPNRILFRNLAPLVFGVAAGELQHLLLDRLQLVGRQGLVAQIHVVVESLVDGQADSELDPR